MFVFAYAQYTDELSVAVCALRDVFENWDYIQDGMMLTHPESPEGDCRVTPRFWSL